MALGEPGKLARLDFEDGPLINFPLRDQAALYQFPQPRRGLGIDLVVVRAHNGISSGMVENSPVASRWR